MKVGRMGGGGIVGHYCLCLFVLVRVYYLSRLTTGDYNGIFGKGSPTIECINEALISSSKSMSFS